MTTRPNPAARQAFYSGWAVAFVGPCALKHGDEPIAFPKLDVVLAMHLLGSTSRSLLVDAAPLRSCLRVKRKVLLSRSIN